MKRQKTSRIKESIKEIQKSNREKREEGSEIKTGKRDAGRIENERKTERKIEQIGRKR